VGQLTTGKVIAELKMVFWQKMFTTRFDSRIWTPHLYRVLPNHQGMRVNVLRHRIHDDLEALRLLRNRIAHHEPIFARVLINDFNKIKELIEFRCSVTATWMVQTQQVTALISTKP
jgi:hypothetical protein